jgi:restriction system protein
MVPTFDKFLFPVLSILKDGQTHNLRELINLIAQNFNLTKEDTEEKIKSGIDTKLQNRTQWATTYLHKAGLVDKPSRGNNIISQEGLNVLKSGITEITPKYLKENYPAFAAFAKGNKSNSKPAKVDSSEPEEETPTEAIEKNFNLMNNELAGELLTMVKAQSPQFFETLVVDLLVKMGYGGSLEENATVTQFSKDEGIDGVIKEDKLGLDKIYVQAKRWNEGIIGRKEIQSFVGALSGQGASKGVFITTSSFSKEARNFKPSSTIKIVLIDGLELCNYMIDYNIGVSVKNTYEIKRIDSDYFKVE